MRYRRADVTGGTYFFTVNLAERQNTLLVDEIDTLRNVMKQVKRHHPFTIDAIVVLPDHLHALLTLPEDDKDFATRWMLIKSGFSRQIPKGERINTSRRKKGERGIWQRRYWEHLIRDDYDYEKHVDYIHHNPVRHGHVKCATDWLYSSIHVYISKGILSHDWGYNDDGFDGDMFGEKV
jgi:putative transposase